MTNKLLKLGILFLFFLTSLSFALSIQKIEELATFRSKTDISEHFSSFGFPEFITTKEEQEKILIALDQVSSKMEVNHMAKIIFHGLLQNDFIETGEISFDNFGVRHQYFLSSHQPSNLFANFNEKIQKIEEVSDAFLLFHNKEDEEFIIAPIQTAENLNPAVFFVETVDLDTVNLFLEHLAQEYNYQFQTNYRASDFHYDFIDTTIDFSYRLISPTSLALIVFTAFFFILWLLENGTTIAIFRLNGLSTTSILWLFAVKPLSLCFLVSFVLVQLLIFQSINRQFSTILFLLLLLFLIIAWILVFFLEVFSLNNQLNKHSYGKYLFPIMYSSKIVLLLLSIGLLIPLAEMGRILLFPSPTIDAKIENYAVFFPLLAGNEPHILHLIEESARGLDNVPLFSRLEEDGAIVSKTNSYFHFLEFDDLPVYRTISLNTNYLKKFPIYSITGTEIHIDNQESRLVYLVPERFLPDLENIRSWFLRKNNPNMPTIKEEDIVFYIIKNKQEIFAFDHDAQEVFTFGSVATKVIKFPYIIEVETINNRNVENRPLYFDGGAFDNSLRVPIQGSAQETYLQYLPLLQKAGLEDNLPFLVPLNDLRRVRTQLFFGESIQKHIIEFLLSSLLTVSLIAYSTLSYFRMHKQKFIIWRLNGLSFFRTYRSIFLMAGVQYLLFLAYIIANGFLITDILTFLFFLTIETITLGGTFFSLERQNFADILEGK